MLMNRDLKNDEIRQRYGLEPYEWTSTLDGTMAAIVGKDMPDRDVYANALLRDGVKAFEREMGLDQYEGRVDNELRDAISQATWGGVIIDDPTMIAIQDADDRHVLPVGAESLARTYYAIHQIDDANGLVGEVAGGAGIRPVSPAVILALIYHIQSAVFR